MDWANSITTEYETGENAEELQQIDDDRAYDYYKDEKVTEEK